MINTSKFNSFVRPSLLAFAILSDLHWLLQKLTYSWACLCQQPKNPCHFTSVKYPLLPEPTFSSSLAYPLNLGRGGGSSFLRKSTFKILLHF